MTRRPQPAIFALLAILAAAWALPGPAHGQQADALFKGFEPWGELLLKVDGKEAPKARLYFARQAQALLVRSAEFPEPVLVDIAGRSVATVDLMRVADRPDGTVDLLADAVLPPSGTLATGADGASFTVDGKRAELIQNPYLLGPHQGFELLDHDVHYRWLADHYEPDAGSIAQLRKDSRPVRVLTFFGSWCPHCAAHVPLLLSAEKAVGRARIEFDYYGLPKTGMTVEQEAAKWGVRGVPTTIVLVDGKEIGRIPNDGWAHPEVALATLLAGGGAAPSPASR
jgi:thiol-disulfide isomerase/thioredoxin